MNIFVLAILFYLLYRFIAGFLIPVIRTTNHVRQQFNTMNKQPQDQEPVNGQHSTVNETRNDTHTGTSKVGEYIDFEEVK